ncbi:MAG: SDR family NAD(P)-dependent oxidoreductase [Alphaproteobacteria bacterium]
MSNGVGTAAGAAARYRGKKVLVTGADGFIGSHLAEALAAAGAEVTALALYNAFGSHGWLDERNGEMRVTLGDVRDGAQMIRLAHGHDLVFHLAALIGIPYSYVAANSYVDVNVKGTLNLLEALRAGGIGRLVHTSTSEVYGTAQFTPISEAHPLQGQSPYAASKIGADMLAESYARSFGLPVAVLRPFNTFGPRQSERAVIPTALRQMLDPACREIALGDLTPVRDFNYVGDTVGAFLALGAAGDIEYGRPYNAGSGTGVSITETIERLREITGCDKPLAHDPARLRPADSEVRALIADASRLTQATGWRPEVTLDEGLGRTAAWWREQLAKGAVRRNGGYAV